MENNINLCINEDREVEYLFVTPFSNGCVGVIDGMPEGKAKRLIVGVDRAETELLNIINNGKIDIKNILFNNAIRFSEEFRNISKQKNIKISSYELGWFPHYRVWHCDPHGFSSCSLLAKSRLDNINIDIDRAKVKIQHYKEKWISESPIFNFNKKYILVVMQHIEDSTIVHDYPDFVSWQKIIDFADSLREKGQALIVKVNPQNIKSKIGVILPENSIAVQSKEFNNYLLSNADVVVGVNSTMLYEASLLYDKPVIAMGNSWFDSHSEVVQKVNIKDKIEIKYPSEKDLEYRKKMFEVMLKMQTGATHQGNNEESSKMLCEKHKEASSVEKIEDWFNV